MTTSRKTSTLPAGGHDPEGAHPVKQARSRLLRDKALGCAHALVRDGRFAQTTMADIASDVGCSVGALYSRFRDKEALFASVVEVQMARAVDALREQARAGRYDAMTLRETVNLCVQDFLEFVLGNNMMIRALYQRSAEQPEYWAIVRAATFEMVQVWVEAVARSGGRSDREYIRQVGIAFQFVSSSLVHTVLIDKHTRPLSVPEHLFWLGEMVMHFIAIDVPEALRGTPVVRPAVPSPGVDPRPRTRRTGAV